MLNRVEVARQIQINHRRHAPQHTAPDFRQGTVWRPLRSKSIGVGAKIRLEDSFQDQLHGPLHHAVADARNLKRSNFAISLRDLHPAVRRGLVPACDEVIPHCRKKRRPPRRLDVLEFLAINPGGAAIALRYTVSLFEGFFAGHRGFLQFPHPPSHHVAADTPPVRAAVSDSFRPALAAFVRYRPSQPPEIRVTRLRLRSLYVATWCVAHTPFRACCRRAPPSCFRATTPPQLRGLSLLTSVGLAPTGRCVLDWTRQFSIA